MTGMEPNGKTPRPKYSDFKVDGDISSAEVESAKEAVLAGMTRAWIRAARQEAYDRVVDDWYQENGLDR